MLTDTHAHLFWDSFKEDLSAVLQRATDAGITTIFNVGTDLETSQIALDQSVIAEQDAETVTAKQEAGGLILGSEATPESDPGQARMTFYSTIGIHPHDAFKYDTPEKLASALQTLEEIYHSNPQKVIGVGECGLDFFFSNNPDWIPSEYTQNQLKDLQIKLFSAQIDLAKKLNLPIIIHVRDDRSNSPENIECWNKALDMASGYKGILHCYSGLPLITQKTLTPEFADFLISFAANITYPKNDYLKEATKILPLDRICLETDSPFLAPQSSRGQRNEPKSVRESAQLISVLKGISLEELAHQTTQNVKTLFKL